MPGYRPEDEWTVTDETGERMTGGWKLIAVLVVALVAVALVAKFAAVPVWVFAALASFVGLPTFCVWKIIARVRTGVMRVRNGSYSRGENPFWYWTLIALLAGLAAWLPGLLILVALHAH